ncbi:manganese efflux pump MntP [Saccharococcus caldoxylosilyticus]|uniref:Putative manganese efflux pump MntP n=1 Tax=Parageobacillus caldoxylosilyticus NBRC 107762 TaxID=1220594 RepID=A0A023DAR5_9BACL|nr:manganese efflux pump MntP family protein [Parageobacillus caldoxylosilyticus]MBB3851136.1 putative Mn2+ efflux pump MntP [Parageobacillus caldoxylosilyticus]GAJ38414.1 putative manganese efflux pump MntP [Parageobacillus caldoxylosilyticus NBRC 107762]
MSMFIGEIIALSMMAFALGMDAFSVALGMGLLRLRLKQIFYIGVMIGLFHILMPMFGMIVGRFLSRQFGSIASYIGGALLLLLGIQMIAASFKKEGDASASPKGIGLIFFAFSVSLDSFSVGLSLGIFGARTMLTILLFGFFSMVLTWMGLMLGRHFQQWLGAYGEALGGSILLAFGLKLLFSF